MACAHKHVKVQTDGVPKLHEGFLQCIINFRIVVYTAIKCLMEWGNTVMQLLHFKTIVCVQVEIVHITKSLRTKEWKNYYSM